TVNTRHLQAVASLGDGFSVAATAPDGVIEAIEHENECFVGVQFHPERMGAATQPLFRALVEEAAPAPALVSN
ncbi:MAG: gamma-glutamyl-gamma-aminobutyrate hydrolase, partial [Bacteroidetes bacterium QH_6_64_77]